MVIRQTPRKAKIFSKTIHSGGGYRAAAPISGLSTGMSFVAAGEELSGEVALVKDHAGFADRIVLQKG